MCGHSGNCKERLTAKRRHLKVVKDEHMYSMSKIGEDGNVWVVGGGGGNLVGASGLVIAGKIRPSQAEMIELDLGNLKEVSPMHFF